MSRHDDPTPHRRPLLKAALVAALSLLALAVVAAQFGAPPVPTAAASAALGASGPAPSTAPGPAQPTIAAAVPAHVRWQDKELLIDFDQLPLQQAVVWLAAATGSTVTGAERLHTATHVTLHARVADVPAAWQLLLQQQAAYSLSCQASSCHLWITTAIGAAPAASTEVTLPGTTPAPADTAPADNESQPGGSC